MELKELIEFTKKLNILYAEDDLEISTTMSDILNVLFNSVITTHDGNEAVHEYKKNKFDLIILDIEMPNKNGFEAAKEIKEIDPNQKIIYLTAHDDVQYLSEALRVGVDDYIVKPFEKDILLEKIEVMLIEK